MTKTILSSTLTLEKLALKLHLGVTDAERDIAQDVHIDFTFCFSELPSGCETDDLAGTICYHHIAQKVEAHCSSKQYNLLENLCLDIYRLLEDDLGDNVSLKIKAIKVNPPMDNVLGVTSFEIG